MFKRARLFSSASASSPPMVDKDMATAETYNPDDFLAQEYPMLKGTIYLDHAGTTVPARSLLTNVTNSLTTTLYGNPHSFSTSSQTTTRRIDDIRLRVLQFFKASPDDFDIVFVANATAGIKLVAEGLRAWEQGFWYGYHRDAHTSLVGVRELARGGQRCFDGNAEVEEWIGRGCQGEDGSLGLFAWPAQSNMSGRRLPLGWAGQLRRSGRKSVYSLMDAAALVSTAPLDLSDAENAPDFTVLSFYKIFGFPDLGALIVRRGAGHVLERREYFGGGTVEMVVCLKEEWHAKKEQTLHEQLEDGTLPFRSIIALDAAMDVHQRLYGSMERISKHTSRLAKSLYEGLSRLVHANREPVCLVYKNVSSDFGDGKTQGPIVAFNIRNSKGSWVSNAEVEKLATLRNIQFRTGGVCNPGGIAHALNLAPWEMKANFSTGQRCGNDNDIMNGKPSGVIRVSLGAMSTTRDIQTFLDFMGEFFVEAQTAVPRAPSIPLKKPSNSSLYIHTLTIYPIKSCAGYSIPSSAPWEIHPEGLAWDREWSLLHLGTGTALSQKQHPQMSQINPIIDLEAGVLRITFSSHLVKNLPRGAETEIYIPLSQNPACFRRTELHDHQMNGFKSQSSRVCGDEIVAQAYTSPTISAFFTAALEVPCTLARFPPSSGFRHAKARSAPSRSQLPMPGAFPTELSGFQRPLLLANESPLLLLTTRSVDYLNTHLPAQSQVPESVFRANIILSSPTPTSLPPFSEESWSSVLICNPNSNMGVRLDVLGRCRRCSMICVDPETGKRREGGEPFVTLSKMQRRRESGKGGGGVEFGVHCGLAAGGTVGCVRVGDVVTAEVGEASI